MKVRGLVVITAFFAAATALAQSNDCQLKERYFDPQTLRLEPQSYELKFEACDLNGSKIDSLREFSLSGEVYRLVVNPKDLSTGILKNSCLSSCHQVNSPKDLSETYSEALDHATAPPFPLQNDGITHSLVSRPHEFLTTDLCPSSKPMRRDFYDRLGEGASSAVPVGISISGNWLLEHESDFEYLKKLESNGKLRITWINHTHTHPYDPAPGLPNKDNFVLMKDVNFKSEIFENEKLLLSRGVVPTVFMRYPGLVSDQAHMMELRDWGIIPIGADAWLALGEHAKAGSIILVHGNGNEPLGLKLFEDLVNEDKGLIGRLSDLKNAFF